MMDVEAFRNLPTAEVARLVREAGPKVCVFPINGTRRWFMLEHDVGLGEDFVSAYLDRASKRHIQLYKMFFDHGVDTLLTPVLGPDILEREGYAQFIEGGLKTWFGQSPDFLNFYDAYDVRVCVYGDTRRYLEKTPYAWALDAFEEVVQRTASHGRYRLFFGVCAHDATETVAEIGIRFYQEHGRPPKRREIVEAYYGESVEPVDLFIGFGPFTAFDMPLLATGNEDLYFTVAPSPYLSEEQLRCILYDHLYARPGEPNYGEMATEDWDGMTRFYRLNRETVLGIGVRARGKIWYPTGGIEFPSGFSRLLLG